MLRRLLEFTTVLVVLHAAACSSEVSPAPSGGSGGSGGGSASSAGPATTGTEGSGAAAGTGGTTVSNTSTTTGVGGTPTPNCPPGDPACLVLAVDRVYWGGVKFNGQADHSNGWKAFGFDVDGIQTNCVGTACNAVTDLCRPIGGASPANVYPDGDEGRDNSFGANVLPIFLAIASDFEHSANESITLRGEGSLLFRFDGLSAAADNPSVSIKVFGGADLGGPPAFDGSDVWPVAGESFSDPSNAESVKLAVDATVVANHLVSSVGTGPLRIQGLAGGIPLDLVLHNPRIALDLSASHDSAMFGQLGGVLHLEEYTESLRRAIGAFDPGLCSGATVEGILNQIRQAADIMEDGTQDPTKQCNGISIGLGFTMRPAQLGPIAPVELLIDPCD